MKLRGALIGCGMISEYHLRGWQRIPEVEIVALADPDLARAEQRRDVFFPRAVACPDLGSALSVGELDFVDILTPPSLHREHCLRSADEEVHIICQKPLCNRLEDAEALIRELDGYGKLFSVHENHPWRPWFRDILALRRTGFFGDELQLKLVQHDRREPPEKFKSEALHGVMLEYGVHLVAMARALLGEPSSAEARFERINPRVRGESLARVWLEVPDGSAAIDTSWQDGGEFSGSFQLIGEAGEAKFEGTMTRGESGHLIVQRGDEVIRDEERSPTDDYVEAFYLLQRDFTEAMLGKSPAPQPATDNLRTLQATFAAYRSAELGKPVRL